MDLFFLEVFSSDLKLMCKSKLLFIESKQSERVGLLI